MKSAQYTLRVASTTTEISFVSSGAIQQYDSTRTINNSSSKLLMVRVAHRISAADTAFEGNHVTTFGNRPPGRPVLGRYQYNCVVTTL